MVIINDDFDCLLTLEAALYFGSLHQATPGTPLDLDSLISLVLGLLSLLGRLELSPSTASRGIDNESIPLAHQDCCFTSNIDDPGHRLILFTGLVAMDRRI